MDCIIEIIKKWWLLIIAGIIVLLLILTMCQNQTDSQSKDSESGNQVKAVLYLENDYGYLVPIVKSVDIEDGVCAAALKSLSDKDTIEGLSPTLSENSFLGIELVGDTVIVNLDKNAFEADNQISEQNKVKAVVNTLTEFGTISKVKITLNGEETKELPYGTDISATFERFDLNAESVDSEVNVAEANKMILYFEDIDLTHIVEITRYTNEEINVENAINELIAGPENTTSLKNLFPEGTRLLTAFIDQSDTVNLNFSSEFSEISESEMLEQCLLKTIGLTCREIDEIKDIRIFVAGTPYEASTNIMSIYPNEIK